MVIALAEWKSSEKEAATKVLRAREGAKLIAARGRVQTAQTDRKLTEMHRI